MKSVLTIPACVGIVLLFSACDPPEYAANSRSSSTNTQASDSNTSTLTAPVVATATLAPASGSNVRGTVSFIREKDGIRVEANLTGLTPGHHGFHIHEKGDCSAPDASSAGAHFNPAGMAHGGPADANRHAGDFGNLEADASGNARYSRTFSDLKLEGQASIIGRAVIVHAKADDLKTQPSGDAGGRIACGVIEKK